MDILIEKDHVGDHPDDLFQSRYATPGFKPFSYLVGIDSAIQGIKSQSIATKKLSSGL